MYQRQPRADHKRPGRLPPAGKAATASRAGVRRRGARLTQARN
jgi:hypothetical protein